MAFPKVKLSDDSGNTVGVTDNKLDVNLGTTPTIDIGDVEIKGHASIANTSNIAVGTSREQLTASDIPCKHVDLQADIANTGIIYVGGTAVVASGLDTGIALYAGDVYSLDIDDVNNVFVIATEDGENVQFTVYN